MAIKIRLAGTEASKRTMMGTPTTGRECFGLCKEDSGKRRAPTVQAKITTTGSYDEVFLYTMVSILGFIELAEQKRKRYSHGSERVCRVSDAVAVQTTIDRDVAEVVKARTLPYS
jgi:hypothetical protein